MDRADKNSPGGFKLEIRWPRNVVKSKFIVEDQGLGLQRASSFTEESGETS